MKIFTQTLVKAFNALRKFNVITVVLLIAGMLYFIPGATAGNDGKVKTDNGDDPSFVANASENLSGSTYMMACTAPYTPTAYINYTAACAGAPITISANNPGCNGCTVTRWEWSDGGDGSSRTVYPGVGTNSYYVRAWNYSCGVSGWSNTVTVTISAQPSAGTASSSPAAGSTICAGTAVSCSASGSGGCGSVADVIQYSSNWGAWTTYSGAVTSAAYGLQFRTYRTATGYNCSTSSTNTATLINVTDQPSAGTASSNPAAGSTICAGTAVSCSASGSGGCGTVTDVIQYSSNGGAWTTYSGAVSAAVNGLQFRTYRTANGTGCNTSGTNTATAITVVAQPSAGTASSFPAAGSTICAGTSVSCSASGSGGCGSVADVIEYSNGGGAWTTYSGAVSAAVSNLQFRTYRTASGTGCNTSSTNTATAITVAAQPSAGTATSSPAAGSTICAGTSVSCSASGSGGCGTVADVIQYSNGGGAWTTYSGAVSAAVSTLQFRTYRTANGTGCNTSGTNTATALTVNASPTASAGGSQDICVGSAALVSGATSSNGTISWTDNGAGSITNGTTLTPTYTSAAGDAGNAVTLTMTVSNAPCTAATANYTVNVKAQPTATAGGNQDICVGSAAIISGATSSNGTISWAENGAGTITANGTTLTPTYTSAAGDAGNTVGLTMTVSNAPCTAATASYTVDVIPQPTASAGGSQDICPGGTATVSGAAYTNGTILWTDNGAGSITSGGTTLTPTYTSDAGDAGNPVTLTMTVSSAPCTAATASYTVNVNNQPSAGNVVTDPVTGPVCEGVSVSASAAGGSGGAGTIEDVIQYNSNGSGWVNYTAPVAASPTTLQFRTYRTASNSGCITSGTNTATALNVTTYSTAALTTFTGSGNWNTAGNWSNGVPGPCQSAVINGSCTITATANCNNLTINPAKDLTINSGQTLAVNGQFTIKSSAAGTGSYLNNGNASYVLSPKVERYIAQDQWHYISAPVQGATVAVWTLAYLKDYNESTNLFNTVITNPLITMPVGKGFAVWSRSVNLGNITRTYTGSLTEGNKVISLPWSGANRGNSLIGNVFTSALNADIHNWTKVNVANSIWVWNPGTGNYQTWNGTVGTLTGGVIPASQGFIVKSTNSGASVTLMQSKRVHSTTAFHKDALANNLVLTVDGNNYSDGLVVNFNNDATNDLDNDFDVEKMNGMPEAPQIATLWSGNELSVNVMPEITEYTIIPVSFNCNTSGVYTFTAEGASSFTSNIPVSLQDMVTGMTTDLRSEPVYQFNHVYNPASSAPRFNLIFGETSVTGINENAAKLNIYSYDNTIVVDNPAMVKLSQITIYNNVGQIVKMLNEPVTKCRTEISNDFVTGTYIVNAIDVNGKSTISKINIQ